MSSRTRVRPKQYWVDNNPVMQVGQYAVEEESGKYKFGDGTTPWRELESFLPANKLTDLGGGESGPAAPFETVMVDDADLALTSGSYFVANEDVESANLPTGVTLAFLTVHMYTLDTPEGATTIGQQSFYTLNRAYARGYQDGGFGEWNQIGTDVI